MLCIYCGRLCDFDETYACNECRDRVSKNNERVYLLALLMEAYPFIRDIGLREKMEVVLFPQECEVKEGRMM